MNLPNFREVSNQAAANGAKVAMDRGGWEFLAHLAQRLGVNPQGIVGRTLTFLGLTWMGCWTKGNLNQNTLVGTVVTEITNDAASSLFDMHGIAPGTKPSEALIEMARRINHSQGERR